MRKSTRLQGKKKKAFAHPSPTYLCQNHKRAPGTSTGVVKQLHIQQTAAIGLLRIIEPMPLELADCRSQGYRQTRFRGGRKDGDERIQRQIKPELGHRLLVVSDEEGHDRSEASYATRERDNLAQPAIGPATAEGWPWPGESSASISVPES